MFKIKANPTFAAVAEIPMPGGGVQELQLVFKHRSRKELEAFIKEMANVERSDVDNVLDMVVDWVDVDQPFNKESVEEFLDQYHDVAQPLMDAYFRGIRGAKRGN